MNNDFVPISRVRSFVFVLITIGIIIGAYAGIQFIHPSSVDQISTAVIPSESESVREAQVSSVLSASASTMKKAKPLAAPASSTVLSAISLSSSSKSTSTLVTKVKYAVLSEPTKDGDHARMRGCDIVSLKEVKVAPTNSPLDASFKALFAKKESWPAPDAQPGNFMSSQKGLKYDKAVIEGDTAKVYLTGTYKLNGLCDDPRIGLQVGDTALQFPGVQAAEIYINGELLKIVSKSVK